MLDRADLDVETLLKVVLVLVIVILSLRVIGLFVDLVFDLFRPLQDLLMLAILVIIVLWLLDRL